MFFVYNEQMEGQPPQDNGDQEGEAMFTKEFVAEKLRTNPEDLSPLTMLLNEREPLVTNSREGLQLIVDKAWAIEASGNFPDAAAEDYLAASEQAWQEGLDDVSRELEWRASAVAGPPKPSDV